jgi:FkbM family methyltransferase
MKLHPLQSITKRLNRVRSFPVLARRRGAVFLLDPQNWVDNRLLSGAPFEDEQLARARELIEAHALDVVFDIGANFGLYSILLGRLDRVTEIVAFEPVRRNHAQLLGNAFANGIAGKFEAHRIALGSSAEERTIHFDPRSTGVSRFDVVDSGRAASAFSVSETVTVRRFDDVCRLEGRRTFVKIDVEGHAPDVLAGMTRFLAANAAILQIEFSGDEGDRSRTHLDAAGYRPLGVIGADHYFAAPSI